MMNSNSPNTTQPSPVIAEIQAGTHQAVQEIKQALANHNTAPGVAGETPRPMANSADQLRSEIAEINREFHQACEGIKQAFLDRNEAALNLPSKTAALRQEILALKEVIALRTERDALLRQWQGQVE
jgi:hypothetical protein